jgi:hypothetical protein
MMPSLSQSRCWRGTWRTGPWWRNFSPDAGKIQGLCETSLTHLSHWTIQPLFHTARNGMAFSPLLSGLSGAYRDLSPDLSFLYLPSLNLPIQPLPCYPSSIDTASPAPDSSRASPRIAPLLLVPIVDKLQVLPHHSDSIPGVSVVNGLQLGSYASNSQG